MSQPRYNLRSQPREVVPSYNEDDDSDTCTDTGSEGSRCTTPVQRNVSLPDDDSPAFCSSQPSEYGEDDTATEPPASIPSTRAGSEAPQEISEVLPVQTPQISFSRGKCRNDLKPEATSTNSIAGR